MTFTSVALRHRQRAGCMFKRAVRRIGRFFAFYASPLGRAVTGVGIACLTAFPFPGWYELPVFGTMAMVVMLAAIVLSLGNTRFHASIVASNHRVTVGDVVSVIVDIGNTGRAPTTTVRGYLPINDTHRRFSILMLVLGRSKQTDVEFCTVSRAILPVSLLRIRKGDPFGLMRHEKELTDRITIFIHPRTARLGTLNIGVSRGLEDQPSGQVMDDGLDFCGLRECEPDGDVRNIHWLSSARTGALMVRQYEATRRTDASVTISVNPGEYVSGEEFEMVVSIHSFIGVRCLLQGRLLFCHAGDTHGQPRNTMEFLDNVNAIESDCEDDPNPTEGTLRHSPDTPFYSLTIGLLKDIEWIKRMTSALPRSASCVVL